MLPPFWMPWLIIVGICVVVGICEDIGDVQGDRANWTKRYTFAVEYSARVTVLAIFCLWAKAIVWAAS